MLQPPKQITKKSKPSKATAQQGSSKNSGLGAKNSLSVRAKNPTENDKSDDDFELPVQRSQEEGKGRVRARKRKLPVIF